MSYSKYYKEHGPSWLNTSLLEIFKKMDISKTKKYLPIYINFFRSRLDDFEVSYKTDGDHQYLFETVEAFIGTEKTNELSFGELLVMYRFVDNMDRERIKTINKFCEFNEKGLFPGLDSTKLTDFIEIESYVATLELKEAEKMFSKQAPKVYDDKNWMVVRPITYESSLKYGATTKWCTASSSNPDHFFRYTRNGALFYILNKTKNYKVALYVPLRGGDGEGPSFWNQVDTRVDSMSLQFDYDIMVFLKSQINSSELCTNEELDSQIWNACFQKHIHGQEKAMEAPGRLIRTTPRMVDTDYVVEETMEDLINELIEDNGQETVVGGQ